MMPTEEESRRPNIELAVVLLAFCASIAISAHSYYERQRSLTIGPAASLLLAAGLSTLALVWNIQRNRLYRRHRRAAVERIALAGRYAHLTRYVNDAVLLIDEDGAIVEANDRAAAMHGYSIDELLQLPIQSLLEQSGAPSPCEVLASLKEKGGIMFESVHRRKDGSTLQVEVSARLIELEGRYFHQSIIRDITERKRAQEQLRRATRAMRVLSASNQALVRSRDESGLFRAICKAITETGGYPLAWIGFAENDRQKSVSIAGSSGPGLKYLDGLQVTWVDEPLGRGPTGTSIRAGRIAVCNNIDADARFEPWRDKAAGFGFRSVVGLPLYCEGAVIGALTIYASEPDAFRDEEMSLLQELAGDLSYGIEAHRRRLDQARAEQAALQSAMEFRTLFDNANDAIFITDLKGRILEANQVASRRMGYSRDELVSMTVYDVDSTASRAQVSATLGRIVEREALLFEAGETRKDGTVAPVEISSRLFDYRHARAILSVARDIGERKQAEAQAQSHAVELERAKTEAEAASRAKGQFLANMSHEIRTPMNGIVGMTGLLLDTALTDEQRDCAETIRNSADALLAIVNDILDFSKIEAGRMEIEPGCFDILACLDEIGELMRPQARVKGLDYVFESSVGEAWVIGDAGRLRQIVLNLLSNAIKFTDRGSVRLSIQTAEPSEGGSWFQISVADTGIGIASEDQPLLFQTFTQVDSSLSKKHQGTGLGLAISRKLAQLMGGNLTVASELGRGAIFVLMLPLRFGSEANAPRHATELLSGINVNAKCRRVLLAEDNAVNQKIGIRLLEKCGCRVDVAANGREAVEMAGRFPYDLLFMDCGMPELDGYAATRFIRAGEAGHNHIPIVALTAHAISGTREDCLAAGMDDYIAKPVSLEAIEEMLLKWSP